MKNLVYILAISVFTLYSCGSKTSQASDNGSETVSVANGENQGTAKAGGSVKLTKEVFLKKVWDYKNSPQKWKYLGDKPALIDFYADWCGPCRKAAPILEEISKEYSDKIHVYKIDTQKERELAAVFQVRGIPAFLYIPTSGKPVMMSGIGRTDDATKTMFKDNIDKYLLSNN